MANSDSHRRDFITGQGLLKSIRAQGASVADAWSAVPETGLPDAGSIGYLEQYARNAMGCEFEWNFRLYQYPQAGAASAQAFDLLEQLEAVMTVYRDESDLSQLNAQAALRPVKLSPVLADVLRMAEQLHQDTSGAFDITSGALSRLWGFDRRQGKLPTQEQIQSTLQSVGQHHVVFDRQDGSLRFRNGDVRINLGSIGKGYALDRVAELFLSLGMTNFLLHGGQSSVVARGGAQEQIATSDEASAAVGSSDVTAPCSKWAVGISHPVQPGVRLAEIDLRNQSLGTSGTARQGFFHQGKRYGHIIDPRNGWPADHFLSTTVLAPQAALSDALATAFFVMTLDEVESYCQRHPEVAAILIRPASRKSGHVILTSLNLPADQIRVVDGMTILGAAAPEGRD